MPELSERGRALSKSLHDVYEFDAHEEQLVLELCRTLDVIDSLAAAIEVDGVMVQGSQGQVVLNGAVAELRQQQAAYARLVTVLNLAAAEGGVAVQRAVSAQASRAANARWSRSKEARGA